MGSALCLDGRKILHILTLQLTSGNVFSQPGNCRQMQIADDMMKLFSQDDATEDLGFIVSPAPQRLDDAPRDKQLLSKAALTNLSSHSSN